MPRKETAPIHPNNPRELLESIEQAHLWVAQGLHDTTCQSLVGVAFIAGALQKKLSAAPEHRELAKDFGQLQEGLKRALGEAREMLRLLRPDPVEDLRVALQEIAFEVSGKVPCEIRCSQSGIQPDAYLATQFARITQEILDRLSLCRGPREFILGFKTTGNRATLSIRVKSTRFKIPAFETKYPFNRNLLELRLRATGAVMEIKPHEIRISCHIRGKARYRASPKGR